VIDIPKHLLQPNAIIYETKHLGRNEFVEPPIIQSENDFGQVAPGYECVELVEEEFIISMSVLT